MSALTISEHDMLSEFLEMYKHFQCLWNTSHPTYADKDAKIRAYKVLLAKYNEKYRDADMDALKKRIENMRCCYRRERKKVATALAFGEDYTPRLWYYPLLTFLDGNHDTSQYDSKICTTEEYQEDDEEEHEMEEEYVEEYTELQYDEEPPEKKPRIKNIYIQDSSKNAHEVINNTIDNLNADHESDTTDRKHNSNDTYMFGKYIGAQLSDLGPSQRFIAEKLISEVIFYARFGKLKPQSAVNLK